MHFPAAIAIITQGNPWLILNLLNKIGKVFSISANATEIHPTKIPAQSP